MAVLGCARCRHFREYWEMKGLNCSKDCYEVSLGMESVAQYMGRWMEVELTDGRLIRGQMMCTDRRPNFILGRSEERWSGETGEPRAIGLAMVGRQHVVRLSLLPNPPQPSNSDSSFT